MNLRLTERTGIGPEISQSVKDIYSAANVRPLSFQELRQHTKRYLGSHSMGGSQRHTHLEGWQDGYPRCRHSIGEKEHCCFEGQVASPFLCRFESPDLVHSY
jgi:hypothetical protein